MATEQQKYIVEKGYHGAAKMVARNAFDAGFQSARDMIEEWLFVNSENYCSSSDASFDARTMLEDLGEYITNTNK